MLSWHTPRARDLRYCAKVALAAVAAYALTLGERNEYVLFSVLGAALVVGGSVGEDLHASYNRVRGTVLGAALGAALALAIGKSIVAMGVFVAILAWLCVGLNWGTTALRVGIAMGLVLLFPGGEGAEDYGGWRVVNTLIGVSIGLGVSRLVWPVRGREEVARAIDRSLSATSATLAALARNVSRDTLRPLQRETLDSLAAISTARTHERLAQQIDTQAELLSDQTMLAVRAAIDTLAASLRLDALSDARAPQPCLAAVRAATASLSVLAQQARSGTCSDSEFARTLAEATHASEHADVDRNVRALLAVLLHELNEVRTALTAIRL